MQDSTRTCVFIDSTSLYNAVIKLFGEKAKLDYVSFSEHVSQLGFCNFKYYCGVSHIKDEQKLAGRNKFISFLEEKLKYDIVKVAVAIKNNENLIYFINKFKNDISPCKIDEINKIINNVSTEIGLNCEICHDIGVLSVVGKYNKFILVSGDDSYYGVLNKVIKNGIDVEIVFFDGCTSELMKKSFKFKDISNVTEMVKI